MTKGYKVQVPVRGGFQQCGESSYSTEREALAVYKDCADYVYVRLVLVDCFTTSIICQNYKEQIE